MPQASEELRAMWEDDNAALAYLASRGIKARANVILVIPFGHLLSQRDFDAIEYMIEEWDFSWERETLKA